MNVAARILKAIGWRLEITVPDYAKSIICVAPHTSNYDFLLGRLAYYAVGRQACFLMKEAWFFPPLGWLLKAIGGIPVPRGKRKGKSALTQSLISRFDASEHLTVAITPEGTRSKNSRWHTGFLNIVYNARDVKLVLGALDYKERCVYVTETYTPTGDIETDMKYIKAYYRRFTAKYPQKFDAETNE